MRRRGFLRGHAFSECPLKSPSFGTFLGEQEKYIPYLYVLQKGIPLGYLFFQVPLENRISMGKISNLPASIAQESTSLLRSLKALKLQVGPTASRPGPMLLKVHSTAEKLVPTEKPSREITVNTAKMMIT